MQFMCRFNVRLLLTNEQICTKKKSKHSLRFESWKNVKTIAFAIDTWKRTKSISIDGTRIRHRRRILLSFTSDRCVQVNWSISHCAIGYRISSTRRISDKWNRFASRRQWRRYWESHAIENIPTGDSIDDDYFETSQWRRRNLYKISGTSADVERGTRLPLVARDRWANINCGDRAPCVGVDNHVVSTSVSTMWNAVRADTDSATNSFTFSNAQCARHGRTCAFVRTFVDNFVSRIDCKSSKRECDASQSFCSSFALFSSFRSVFVFVWTAKNYLRVQFVNSSWWYDSVDRSCDRLYIRCTLARVHEHLLGCLHTKKCSQNETFLHLIGFDRSIDDIRTGKTEKRQKTNETEIENSDNNWCSKQHANHWMLTRATIHMHDSSIWFRGMWFLRSLNQQMFTSLRISLSSMRFRCQFSHNDRTKSIQFLSFSFFLVRISIEMFSCNAFDRCERWRQFNWRQIVIYCETARVNIVLSRHFET